MLVHQILKSKADDSVMTVKPGTSIEEILKILADKKIGTVLVSKDGKTPDGILSERDIVRKMAKHGGAVLSAKVEEPSTAAPDGAKHHDERVSVHHRRDFCLCL